MNFFKTSFYTSISTGITFLCGFIVAKVVAVKIGPPGIAMVGQFQNTMVILTMMGSGAINMGVVKYLSQSKGNTDQQQKIITNALSLVIACSLVVSIFIMAASAWLSKATFHTVDFWVVYFLFGAFLCFTTLNAFTTSAFNGLQEIKKLTYSNIFFSITGVIFTVLFAYQWSVRGVLIAVNATAVCVFIFNIFLTRQLPIYSWRPTLKNWDKNILRQLLAFSLMSLLSTLALPGIQLVVRNKIITEFSATEAGYWQAVTRISDYYLAFITTVLGVYYLPKFSEIQNKEELKKEVYNGYKVILPVVGLLALLIGLFRHYIVLVLFSPAFLPMKPLFTFQLIGDFIKIAGWLLGFIMWAKAMVKTFLITEFIFSVTFVMWSFFFIDRYGLVGATYGFAINYLMYLITMLFLMKRKIF